MFEEEMDQEEEIRQLDEMHRLPQLEEEMQLEEGMELEEAVSQLAAEPEEEMQQPEREEIPQQEAMRRLPEPELGMPLNKKPRTETVTKPKQFLNFLRQGQLDECKSLVNGSATIEEREEVMNFRIDNVGGGGWTALHFAANYQMTPIIEWILSAEGREAGFKSVLTQTSLGETALLLAAQTGNWETFLAVVTGCTQNEREEILNMANVDNETVLHKATLAGTKGSISIIQWLLSEEGRSAGFSAILKKEIREGRLAIHLAAEQGNLEACKAIANCSYGEKERMMNGTDRKGGTALHCAVSFESVSLIEWLLSDEGRAAGFNSILATDRDKEMASNLAVRKDSLNGLKAILRGCKMENGEREVMLTGGGRGRGPPVLHDAVFRGNCLIVCWLLSAEGREAGFKYALYRDGAGKLATHLAAQKGHLNICEALFTGSLVEDGEREEMINGEDRQGKSILHVAAEYGQVPIIRWLLSDAGREAGFRAVLARDKEGKLAMHFAAAKGHVEACKALVAGCKVENGERDKMLNGRDNLGRTALHDAANWGQTAVIRWMLSDDDDGGREAGFNAVAGKGNDGQNAMHFAVHNSHLEACQALVYGSKVENGEREELLNGLDSSRNSILHFAAKMAKIPIIQWLLSDEGRLAGFRAVIPEKGKNALHVAAARGNVETCNALVVGCRVENGERDEMLNGTDEFRWTVLHHAVEANQVKSVQWLCPRKDGWRRIRDITMQNNEGCTAMHLAAQRDIIVCKAIADGCNSVEERAAMMNSKDSEGLTPLHHAAKQGQFLVIQWLFSEEGKKAGFDRESLFALTNYSESVMHLVSEDSHDCTESLLGFCSSLSERLKLISAKNAKQQTFLHLYSQRPQIVHRLFSKYPVEMQEIANSRDNAGMTPLHRAVLGGMQEVGEGDDATRRKRLLAEQTVAVLLGFEKRYLFDAQRNYQAHRVIVDPNLSRLPP